MYHLIYNITIQKYKKGEICIMSKSEKFDNDTVYQVVIRNHGRKLLMKKHFKKKQDAEKFYNECNEHFTIVGFDYFRNGACYTLNEKKIY